MSATVSDKPPGPMWQRVRKRKPDARLAHLHNLQTLVHRLHQEVESLKLTRELLMDRQLQRADQLGGSFERIVREYFSVFRFGMQLDDRAAPFPSARATERFLRTIMDENVNGATPLPGLENFIELNKRYSLAFAQNRLELLDVKVFPVDGEFIAWDNARMTVSGWGQYSCYITQATIEMIFPHAKANAALVAKLLGKHIKGVGRYDFVFDTETSRVVATDVDLNFVPVFMAALRDPRDVAYLFDEDEFTKDYVIPDPEDPAARSRPRDTPSPPRVGPVPMHELLS